MNDINSLNRLYQFDLQDISVIWSVVLSVRHLKMEYFRFQHVVPIEERYRSFTYCVDIGKKRILKLRRYVSKLKLYVRDEEKKIKSRTREEQLNEDKLKETLKDLTEESEDLSEELDSLKENVLFTKDELFWKGIHRKHVKEDLTVLKVIAEYEFY